MTEQLTITDYFGFDLGDGESAVAWVRSGTQTEPQLIEISGRKSCLTALGEHGEMGTLIGEQAYLADADKLYLRFKSKYLDDREYAAPLIRRFARAVLSELMKSGKLTDVDRAAFFVGCPSGWSDCDRDDYKLLFEQAGFRNVTIVSESRAAFLFVRESGELNLSDSTLARPTLIIDSGSSTTDLTFINELRTVRAFDFGETHLGGGLIDQMLLEVNLRRSASRYRLAEIFEQCPQYLARCELEARKVKEMYFTRRTQGGGAHFSVPCESSVKIYYQRPPLSLDICCDDRDMDEILKTPIAQNGGKSYLDAYKKCLMDARDQLKTAPPEQILMTGGASRMDFIAQMAQQVFPDTRILFGAEPEFSIARGLCYALRVDKKTEAFERDVRALIDSDDVEDMILHALPRLFYAAAPAITDGLIEDCAVPAFRRWKAGELQTMAGMSDEVRVRLEDSLKNGAIKDAMAPAIGMWLESIRPEIEALTDPICARYDLPLTSLRLPSALGMDAVRIDVATGDLMDFSVLQTVVDVAIGAIVGGLLGGGGVALLMAGPIGFVISFAIGFVASRLGTSYAKKHLDNVEIPQWMRMIFTTGAFRRQLEGKREQLEHQFADQLITTIDPPTEQIDALQRTITGAIERQLGQMADRARLLIH